MWPGFVLLAVVGAVVLFMRATAHAREHLNAMKRDPPMLTGSVVHGSVGRFCGGVEVSPGQQLLISPLTGRPCAYYEVQIRQEKSMGGQRSTWTTVFEEARGIPFWLRDDSGRVCINPQGAAVLLNFDAHEGSGTLDNPTPQEASLLARAGLHPTGRLGGNAGFKYKEGVLAPGEPIVATGTVQEYSPTSAQESGYRHGERNLWLMATDNKPLMLTDHAKMVRVSRKAMARGRGG